MILLALVAFTAPLALAEAQPTLSERTLKGQPFQLSALRGKVVMVVFWSTECPVCRDRMAELRQNYAGWKGKPFELVAVSVDRRVQDLADYDAITNTLVPLRQRFVQLWQGEPGYADNFPKPLTASPGAVDSRQVLPQTYILNKQGALVAQYSGRVPADVWDQISDLL